MNAANDISTVKENLLLVLHYKYNCQEGCRKRMAGVLLLDFACVGVITSRQHCKLLWNCMTIMTLLFLVLLYKLESLR